MTTIRSALTAALLVGSVLVGAAALAGCSTGPAAGAPATPSSAPGTAGAATATGAVPPTSTTTAIGSGKGAVGSEEALVEAALRDYQNALATGDFVRACLLNSPESSVALITAVQAGGGQVGTCEEALAAVFTQPGAAAAAAEAAASTTVDDIVIDGLNATVSWTSMRQGQARTDGARLQVIDGAWRLAGAA